MQEILDVNLRTEDVMHGKYLTFGVGNGVYGIEIKYVTEIIKVQDITVVPRTNVYVKGIINLRGKIVPVIDMGLRFGIEEKDYSDRTCIIVLGMENMSIGLIVDEVQEVADIDDDKIQAPPQTMNEGEGDEFVKSIGLVGNDVKQLLDINKIFEEEEMAVY